jgi:hypothetical protein
LFPWILRILSDDDPIIGDLIPFRLVWLSM